MFSSWQSKKSSTKSRFKWPSKLRGASGNTGGSGWSNRKRMLSSTPKTTSLSEKKQLTVIEGFAKHRKDNEEQLDSASQEIVKHVEKKGLKSVLGVYKEKFDQCNAFKGTDPNLNLIRLNISDEAPQSPSSLFINLIDKKEASTSLVNNLNKMFVKSSKTVAKRHSVPSAACIPIWNDKARALLDPLKAINSKIGVNYISQIKKELREVFECDGHFEDEPRKFKEQEAQTSIFFK